MLISLAKKQANDGRTPDPSLAKWRYFSSKTSKNRINLRNKRVTKEIRSSCK